MGIEVKPGLVPEPCKCYQLDHGEICFRRGIIGALSDPQEERLCSRKEVSPPTRELKERYTKFVDAIHAAQKRYHEEQKVDGIKRWLELTGEELRARGVEV